MPGMVHLAFQVGPRPSGHCPLPFPHDRFALRGGSRYWWPASGTWPPRHHPELNALSSCRASPTSTCNASGRSNPVSTRGFSVLR